MKTLRSLSHGSRIGTFLSVALVACGALTFVCTPAFATLLLPGTSVVPGPTPAPAGATSVAGPLVTPFIADDPGAFTGTLTSEVFTNDAANPFGPGFLSFTFRVQNNGPDELHRFVAVNYQGYNTDVSFSVSAPLGVQPALADRSGNGRVVGFNFPLPGGGIGTGAQSDLLVIHTNATQWMNVFNSVINGSTANPLSFGPVPIPEPGMIGALTVAGLGLVVRRTRRAS
jgi:hypothetical protein